MTISKITEFIYLKLIIINKKFHPFRGYILYIKLVGKLLLWDINDLKPIYNFIIRIKKVLLLVVVVKEQVIPKASK